jgi:hypothetical protein
MADRIGAAREDASRQATMARSASRRAVLRTRAVPLDDVFD